MQAAFDAARIDPRRWPSFERALASLAASDFLVPDAHDAHEGARQPYDRRSPRQPCLVAGEAVRSCRTDEAGARCPICLTWELTYACNPQQRAVRRVAVDLANSRPRSARPSSTNCNGCRSSTTSVAANPRFARTSGHLVRYVDHGVGVKFSTNGSGIDAEVAEQLAESDYVDVQISIDGADAETNDHVREAVRSPRLFGRWSTSRPPGSRVSRSRW